MRASKFTHYITDSYVCADYKFKNPSESGPGVKECKNFHLSPGQVHQNFYLSCYQITCPCQGKINQH